MRYKLQDRIALVTGGSRGIGYAISEAYLKEGAKVIICARDDRCLQEAAEELRKHGEILPIRCDISKLDSVKKMVDQLIERYGKIDFLVNNAAIGMTFGRVGDVDPSHWSKVIRVNLIGTFHCCHAVIPHMLKQGAGGIINLKGYGAGFPSPRVTAYGASKAGISAFTRSLAREYRETGICVNLLSPGLVKTNLLMNRDTTEEGAIYLKRFKPIMEQLAGDALPAASLAVKIVSKEMAGVTGKEFRVLSRTKMLIQLSKLGLQFLLGRSGGRL
ncbi:SDR family oxidoreductase [Nitrospira defluvii]|nr:SDR family oxidoreductase [Nitrospira defluvii]